MINLLPDPIKEDMVYGRKNRQIINWIVTAVFGVVILFIIAAVGRLTIQTARDQALVQKENMVEQLKVADFDTVSEEYGDYVDGLGSVKKLYGQQILYTRLIRKLGTLLPAGARLTNISLSDKDRAVGLNFDNDTDGLGPVILLNLTDQSKQVSDKTRVLFANNLRIPLAGKPNELGNPTISSDKTKKTLEFAVHSPNGSLDERLTTAALSGGDMAFMLIYDTLETKNNLVDYKAMSLSKKSSESPEITKEKIRTIAETIAEPQIRSYVVRPSLKAVDYLVSADSLEEAKQIQASLLSAPNSIFIEAYTFEDSRHPNKNKCTDEVTGETVCDATCKTGTECSVATKVCRATSKNGCRYIVRAYYDELYASMSVKKLSSDESKKCSEGSAFLGCTHIITATYSQLFSKVDTNRVSACTIDPTTGASACPVEMRAEFSEEAKFYLINSGASK
jgi:hypothetical protein